MKVASIFVKGCLMNVGKKDKYVVVGIEAEVVRSHLVDLCAEVFHVDLEQFAPVEFVLEQVDFEGNHLTFGGAFGSSSGSMEEVTEMVLVDAFGASVGVVEDGIGDIGA